MAQKDVGTLNQKTIEKHETIKKVGYNHVSTYECQLAKNKDFQKFAKNFTQELQNHLIQGTLFMEEEPIQPNSYTILKKMSVGAPSQFLLTLSNCSIHPEKYHKSCHKLIKCKVVPPKGLYHPVLPPRIKVDNYEKLTFTLC